MVPRDDGEAPIGLERREEAAEPVQLGAAAAVGDIARHHHVVDRGVDQLVAEPGDGLGAASRSARARDAPGCAKSCSTI